METTVIFNKIEVLNEAKELISKDTYGICVAIKHVIFTKMNRKGIYSSMSELQNIYPKFTRDNMIELFKARPYEPPYYHIFWWPLSEKDIRFKVIDYLIQEAQNEPQTFTAKVNEDKTIKLYQND